MKPSNSFVGPLLTDLYQLTMAYGYWKSGKHNLSAVFDLHFRKNPFRGEFTIFSGLEEVISFVSQFRFRDEEIEYLQKTNFFGRQPEREFFDWLRALDCSKVKIYAIPEGSLVFPREPLLRVEGPLAITQLLETTLLTLVNYASLITTNAARFRLASGMNKALLEFGLRRAQGPDGGVSASRYSYQGGFNATSNVLAGKLFNIPVRGTNAHSFITSFSSLKDIKDPGIIDAKGNSCDFIEIVLKVHDQQPKKTHEGELAAFIAYAQSYPDSFLALVDTYDTLQSGVPNFITVALALLEIGYRPIGIRLDSGDLAYLSKKARQMFTDLGDQLPSITIVASNDINEATLLSLNQQGHEIDAFGIGTHLVTCQAQPSLGGVYKLVQVDDKPCIKLSQDIQKITIAGKKELYRLTGTAGYPILDLMVRSGDKIPQTGQKILCRHPFKPSERVYAVPSEVTALHKCYWDGTITGKFPRIDEIRQYVLDQLANFRPDHLRELNPTPYKVSVSDELFQFFHQLWQDEAPIREMH